MRLTNAQVRVLKAMKEGCILRQDKKSGKGWVDRSSMNTLISPRTINSLRNRGLIRIDLSKTHYVRYTLTTKCENSTIVGTQLI